MSSVNIEAIYITKANYALFHNNIPICQSVEITNTSDNTLEDVIVVCTGDFISHVDPVAFPAIKPNETVRIAPFNLRIDSSKLASLTERVITDFKISVSDKGDNVGEKTFKIELMSFDHWTGQRIMPQTIASFITPNHPSLNDIIVRSANFLKQITGSSVLMEYQTGDINDVRNQIAAVFMALHEKGIVYRALPASFETEGQRITLPHKVLSSKIGNCIELTLLMASVLETIGLNTIIIFVKGHAMLGVWLVDDCCSCSVSDDASFIEKKCSHGINEMLVIETTNLTSEHASFDDAIRMATHTLSDHDRFQLFVDVKRARLEQIRPLPVKTNVDGTESIETDGVRHDSCRIEVTEHDRFDLTHLTPSNRTLTKFDIWERKLLDFSLRNSLLNLSLRRRAIQFISFDINRIEDHLQDGKEYIILPKPDVPLPSLSGETLFNSKRLDPIHELIHNDIEHLILHTYFPEGMSKTLLKNIYRAARNTIEETGANSLFLAIGTLRWYETDKSTTPRYAPLLLLPVEMVYKKGNYYIRTRDEEITLNITLLEFLRQNYNITFKGLDPLPLDDSGVDVPLIFAIIRDALKVQRRWDVAEECLLGTFSFSKFLMWNDIHSHRDALSKNDIINSLVANRLTWTPETFTTDIREYDSLASPADLALPVPVDSSQLSAVLEGGKGNSFILYGPPGTGKSQTITNLIANALFHGKRVLFVAEKMAALSVVKDRLEKIGLGPFCLELHSNKSTKQHVLSQLDKALKVAHIVPPAEYKTQAEKIHAKRKELISYLSALHYKDDSDGLSLYDCILRYENISAEPLEGFRYDKAVDTLINKDGIEGLRQLIGNRLDTILRLVDSPSSHPLKGLNVNRDMLRDLPGVEARMKEDSDALQQYSADYSRLSEVKNQRERLLRDNSKEILDQDPEALRKEWRKVKAQWFLPRLFAERKYIDRLRQFNPLITKGEIDKLIEDLIVYQKGHSRIKNLHAIISRNFGKTYPDDTMPPMGYINDSVSSLNRWAANTYKMPDWYHWSEYCNDLRKNGLECLVDVLESKDIKPDEIREAYMKALFRHKAQEKINQSDLLPTFEGILFDEKIADYRIMTTVFQVLTQKELYARLASRVPRMTDNVGNGSEIGLLNRNISNGGRGLSLRDLFDQLPTLLPKLCPCMLMSPMSVAQYIDLTADKFDLVIFDEASQMPTSEAVGAIARGKALIVVGDPKQMPPTSFFTSTNVDEEEAAIDDMESILEDCRTLDLPSLQLSWHYRSRHESLIAFSNNEYYDGSLITFPSSDDKETKVSFTPVKGTYDKGGSRINTAEAEAVVNEIVRRLRDEKLRRSSIGVIAFSVMQQGVIEDKLQERLESDRQLQEAAAGMYEPIFIKNLENVQGDERDVILFSIGYGPDRNGKISMNFGPLNNAGGERRLNVAVSRARQEMHVYSSLRSSDIDLRRSKAKGVEGLKHFLQYAETQSLPTTSNSSSAHKPTIVAHQIAEELRNRGYKVTVDVGRSSFRVDVAVESDNKPGCFSLAILLDGETYNNTPTARDREVVQPAVLSSLRWKVMRVWSVDWFKNKLRVIDRILEKLNEIREEENTNKEAQETPADLHLDFSNEEIEETPTFAKDYNRLFIPVDMAKPIPKSELMRMILNAEQPITPMYLCRRINALQEAGRVTKRLQDEIMALSRQFYLDKDNALWLTEEDSQNYPYYRPNSNRDITEIPQIEIINVIIETLREQVALNEDNLSLLAAKKLGFARRGTNVDEAFKKAIQKMLLNGKIELIGENLRIKES